MHDHGRVLSNMESANEGGRGMKRLLLVLTAGLAAAALVAGTGAGAPPEVKGPPCANIENRLQTDYYNTAEDPDLQWTFVLGGRSCAAVTYTLEIYDDAGTSLLDTVTLTGDGSSNQVVFNYNFDGTPAADPDGVCLAGTTRIGERVLDTAPDGANCFPVEHGGSGQSGGFG
jgi:hypothetical protein